MIRLLNHALIILSEVPYFYPMKYTERRPIMRFSKAMALHEQIKITKAENGMRKGAGIRNHSPKSKPRQTK